MGSSDEQTQESTLLIFLYDKEQLQFLCMRITYMDDSHLT